MDQAKAMYRSGNLRGAATLLAQVLRFQPNNADAMQLQGAIQFQSGFEREGKKMVERALALDPKNAEAWNNLGLIHHFSGENEKALEHFRKAAEADPELLDAWRNAAFLLQLEGQHVQALQALSKAGDRADIHFFRGNSFAALSQHEAAIEEFGKCIALEPANFDAWINRTNSLLATNHAEEAIKLLQEVLKTAGQHPELHAALAAALVQIGRVDEALTVAQLVLKWAPTTERAQNVRRVAEELLREQERIAAQLGRIEADEELVEEKAHVARSLQNQGKWREAIAAVRGNSNAALRFIEALTLPVLCRDEDEVGEVLEHMWSRLESLIEDRPLIEDPLAQIGLTTFHLPYLGASDRPLQELTAEALYSCTPSLKFEAAFTPGKGKKRLGVVSALLHEHTISKVFGGLIEGTNREEFELVFFQIGKDDPVAQRFAALADAHIRLPNDLTKAREAIARSNIDLLFYPELGMHPATFYLAYSRLAPVQFTTWGHPYTSGSPEIDVYLSSEHLDREDAQAEYTERLVRLPHLNMVFEPAAAPTAWTRADFGLPEGKRLYGVSQMPYKFHPEFDRVLNEIVTRDPEAIIVLVVPGRSYFKQLLLERWSKRCPGVLDRIVWLHLMPHDRFLRLLQLTDVQLAPLQFGAGRSTLDAMSVGAPMITWQGPYLKSRITSAVYHQMGFTELVSESESAYIDLALRVAQEPDFNAHVRAEIRRTTPLLFNPAPAVREWNEALRTLSNSL